MSDERVIRLMALWDEVDGAAQRIVMALPHQITEAAMRLDTVRLQFRRELNAFAMQREQSAPEPATPELREEE